MAFNDFLDKVKDTSMKTMDKAKDTTKRLANINDLKSQIRSLKNDKNKLFTDMGMDVYLARKEGRELSEMMDAFVDKVDSINANIKELQEKLALIQTED